MLRLYQNGVGKNSKAFPQQCYVLGGTSLVLLRGPGDGPSMGAIPLLS